MAEANKKPQLVIDTNVLIQHADLQSLMLQFNLFTVPAVLTEVRDQTAKARLATISSSLKVETPDKNALDRIAAFAKKTGDFISLSPVDVQVIALAYAKIKDNGKLSMLRDEPLPASNFKDRLEGDDTMDGDSDEDEEEEEAADPREQIETPIEENHQKQDDEKKKDEVKKGPEEGQEQVEEGTKNQIDEDDENKVDDDGWITVGKPKKEKTHRKPNHMNREHNDDNKSESLSSNLLSKSLTVDQELDKNHPQLWYDNRDFEPDDEEGWITPKNLNNILKGAHVTEANLITEVGVGIMTADFAMQVCLAVIV